MLTEEQYVLLKKADEQSKAKDSAATIQTYREILSKGVTLSAQEHFQMGEAFYMTKDIVYAMKHFEFANKKDPSNDEYLLYLGMARHKSK